jgi:hypothetical protein
MVDPLIFVFTGFTGGDLHEQAPGKPSGNDSKVALPAFTAYFRIGRKSTPPIYRVYTPDE